MTCVILVKLQLKLSLYSIIYFTMLSNLSLKLSAEFLDLIYVRGECRLQFSMSADVFLNVHPLHSALFLLFWKVFIESRYQDHVF